MFSVDYLKFMLMLVSFLVFVLINAKYACVYVKLVHTQFPYDYAYAYCMSGNQALVFNLNLEGKAVSFMHS